MSYADITVHGIRFHWDYDAEEYVAQVTPDDIHSVWNEAQERLTNGETVMLPKSEEQAKAMMLVATSYLPNDKN